MPPKMCISKNCLLGLLAASGVVHRTLTAVLKNPQEEHNNLFCTARREVLPCKLQTLSWEPAQRPAWDQGWFFRLLAVPTGGGVSRLIFPTEEGRTGSLFLHPLPPSVIAPAGAQQNTPGSPKGSEKPRAQGSPMENREKLLQACKTHGQTHRCLGLCSSGD